MADPLTFAYQGEPGAYSELAGLRLAAQEGYQPSGAGTEAVKGIPCRSFRVVLERVTTGQADLGVLPIENSTEGNIDEATDLLQHTDLHVVGETELRIQHCLMARPGTRMEDVTHVHSHPQGLRQCRAFLDGHPSWRRVAEEDTAGSAALVARMGDTGDGRHAAIAGAHAAETYGLEVLASGIETRAENHTRFFVFARRPMDPHPEPTRLAAVGATSYKSTLLFAVHDRPGALYEALGVFAENGVNLTKLESRPWHREGRRWDYLFLVDCIGHQKEPHVSRALDILADRLHFLKVVGSYPARVGMT